MRAFQTGTANKKGDSRIASVYINTLAAAIDREFDYLIPHDMVVKPAMRVVVPFGKGNKQCQAFVVSVKDGEGEDLKSISNLIDDSPCLPSYMIDIFEFLRKEYFCTFREALGAAFPGSIDGIFNIKEQKLAIYSLIAGNAAFKPRKNATSMLSVIEYLNANGPTEAKALEKATKASHETLARMENKGLISKTYLKALSEWDKTYKTSEKPKLLDIQKKALELYRSDTGFESQKYMLHGITGSGKTFCFFEMMDDAIAAGKQCLLLVPEIALTSQLAELTQKRFAQKVAIVHSRIPAGERSEAFAAVRDGKAKIVLGARSAVFLPFQNLGLIVVDEEHENSYKSSSSPRYSTIAVAEKISDLTGARLVLSSATPSTETYYKTVNGQYKLIELNQRANGKSLPPVEIVDMRDELKTGNRSPISRRLQNAMADRLKRKEQSLLFLNRRGFSTYVFCRKCGYTIKCTDCDVALTYHKGQKTLLCHYCGQHIEPPSTCPICGSEKIRYMGAGTEQIQSACSALFPEAKILRLDSDSIISRFEMERILKTFAKGEADILIGTQMAVKGLDFQNVSLVGIILADVSLNFPDLNSPARTFQLIEQASGRAGRGDKLGETLLQTYTPSNRTLLYASEHNYSGFYSYDISYRQSKTYPPYSEILGVFVANEDPDICENEARKVYDYAKSVSDSLEKNGAMRLFSPAPASLQKLKGKFIYHILILCKPGSAFKDAFRAGYNSLKASVKSSMFVETNPATLL